MKVLKKLLLVLVSTIFFIPALHAQSNFVVNSSENNVSFRQGCMK